MAKWGEGDPRWIVENRPDAKNVNNWHWSESDASVWSESKLKSLLVGLEFTSSNGACKTTEMVSCSGEATANNRKGKLIFFYEWQIKLSWKGTCQEDETAESEPTQFSGEISIPNLSEENDPEDVDVIVTSKKSSKDAIKLKELVHRVAPKIIREKLAEYLASMREEFSRGLILPRKSESSGQNGCVGVSNNLTSGTSHSTKSDILPVPAARSSSSPIGCRIYTARLSLTETFMAAIEEIYDILTLEQKVEHFTRCRAIVENYKGGKYSILNEQISGEFIELVRPSKIVLKWRQKNWPDSHYSKVVIDLTQESSGTTLTLLQTEVPESLTESVKSGWRNHIFNAMKMTFGLGLPSI